jgi:hypothetical protein
MEIQNIRVQSFETTKICGVCMYSGKNYFYKISPDLSHEYVVSKSLESIESPHFFSGIQLLHYPINIHNPENPFVPSKTSLSYHILLTEFVENKTLFEFINSESVSSGVLFSLIIQTLSTILVAQECRHFTHYDLHSNNVLVIETDKSSFEYEIGNAKYTIPTYGYMIKIVDFGFSYTSDCRHNSIKTTFLNSSAGYLPGIYCTGVDFKMFLISVLSDIKLSPTIAHDSISWFETFVVSQYKTLSVDWVSGWNKTNEPSITEELYKSLSNKVTFSNLFTINYTETISQLHSICVWPLYNCIQARGKECDYIEILYNSFCRFVTEFHKFEEYSGYHYELLVCILRDFLDICREYYELYKHHPQIAIKTIHAEFVSLYPSTANISDLSFPVMIVSIFAYKECIETYLHEELTNFVEIENEEYENISCQEIFDALVTSINNLV